MANYKFTLDSKTKTLNTANKYLENNIVLTVPDGSCAISGGGLSKGAGAVSGSNIILGATNNSGISVSGSGSVSRAAITDTHTKGWINAKPASTVIDAASATSNIATKYVDGLTLGESKTLNSISLNKNSKITSISSTVTIDDSSVSTSNYPSIGLSNMMRIDSLSANTWLLFNNTFKSSLYTGTGTFDGTSATSGLLLAKGDDGATLYGSNDKFGMITIENSEVDLLRYNGTALVQNSQIINGLISTGTTDKTSSGYTDKVETGASGDLPVPANGYLYLSEGWYPNTQISLAALIPDDSTLPNAGSGHILKGYEAYDTNGNKLKGTIDSISWDSNYYTTTNTGYGVINSEKYTGSSIHYIKKGVLAAEAEITTSEAAQGASSFSTFSFYNDEAITNNPDLKTTRFYISSVSNSKCTTAGWITSADNVSALKTKYINSMLLAGYTLPTLTVGGPTTGTIENLNLSAGGYITNLLNHNVIKNLNNTAAISTLDNSGVIRSLNGSGSIYIKGGNTLGHFTSTSNYKDGITIGASGDTTAAATLYTGFNNSGLGNLYVRNAGATYYTKIAENGNLITASLSTAGITTTSSDTSGIKAYTGTGWISATNKYISGITVAHGKTLADVVNNGTITRFSGSSIITTFSAAALITTLSGGINVSTHSGSSIISNNTGLVEVYNNASGKTITIGQSSSYGYSNSGTINIYNNTSSGVVNIQRDGTANIKASSNHTIVNVGSSSDPIVLNATQKPTVNYYYKNSSTASTSGKWTITTNSDGGLVFTCS